MQDKAGQRRRYMFAMALMLWGCGSGRMAAPADVVAAAEELPVQDRSSWSGALADESFRLGAMAVTDVDRDWNSESEVSILGFSDESTEGGYAFKLRDNDTIWSGACTTAVEERSLSLGNRNLNDPPGVARDQTTRRGHHDRRDRPQVARLTLTTNRCLPLLRSHLRCRARHPGKCTREHPALARGDGTDPCLLAYSSNSRLDETASCSNGTIA